MTSSMFLFLVYRINHSQAVREKADKEIHIGLKALEADLYTYVELPLREKFPTIQFMSTCRGYNSSPDWKPSAVVHAKWNGQDAFLAKRLNHNSPDTVLGWFVGRKRVDVGIDPQALIDECERVSEATGTRIEPNWWFEPLGGSDPESCPACAKDIADMYGETAVLDHGIVAFKGWDIADSWAIARIDNTIRLYYWGQNQPHGVVEKAEEFLDLIEQDTDNAYVRENWLQTISGG